MARVSESILIEALIPAKPAEVYRAWLSGPEHTEMTGSPATHAADGAFTAWDGYISGETIGAEASRCIVQDWRTTDFPEDAPDSRLEVTLEAEGGKTRVTLRHSEIPDGQGARYESGWKTHYFEPMAQYFASKSSRRG
jgi:activator of HSP90 ATPase